MGGVGGYSEAHVFYLSMSLKVGHFSIYIPPPTLGASAFYLSMSKKPPPYPP